MILDFLSPHLPHEWNVRHKTGNDPHNLGDDLSPATSTVVPALHPAIKWSFKDKNGNPVLLRLSVLDQHGHVTVEINNEAKQDAGAKGGVGNMGGASAIVKCTFDELVNGQEVKHEYRFEGKLINVPFI